MIYTLPCFTSNQPQLFNYRCIPGGLWLQDISWHLKVTNQGRSKEEVRKMWSVPPVLLEGNNYDVHQQLAGWPSGYWRPSIPTCQLVPHGLDLRWWGILSFLFQLFSSAGNSAWGPYLVLWLDPISWESPMKCDIRFLMNGAAHQT